MLTDAELQEIRRRAKPHGHIDIDSHTHTIDKDVPALLQYIEEQQARIELLEAVAKKVKARADEWCRYGYDGNPVYSGAFVTAGDEIRAIINIEGDALEEKEA